MATLEEEIRSLKETIEKYRIKFNTLTFEEDEKKRKIMYANLIAVSTTTLTTLLQLQLQQQPLQPPLQQPPLQQQPQLRGE
jgi:hypothetical protein